MKITLSVVALAGLMCASVASADLPTISVNHLYYLRVRGEHIRKLSADDMIDYCIAQKLGSRAFEDLYSQLFQMRIDLTKLQRVEGVSDDDSRVKTLKKRTPRNTVFFRTKQKGSSEVLCGKALSPQKRLS